MSNDQERKENLFKLWCQGLGLEVKECNLMTDNNKVDVKLDPASLIAVGGANGARDIIKEALKMAIDRMNPVVMTAMSLVGQLERCYSSEELADFTPLAELADTPSGRMVRERSVAGGGGAQAAQPSAAERRAQAAAGGGAVQLSPPLAPQDKKDLKDFVLGVLDAACRGTSKPEITVEIQSGDDLSRAYRGTLTCTADALIPMWMEKVIPVIKKHAAISCPDKDWFSENEPLLIEACNTYFRVRITQGIKVKLQPQMGAAAAAGNATPIAAAAAAAPLPPSPEDNENNSSTG